MVEQTIFWDKELLKMMRAIRFEHFGSPEQLQLQELSFPNLSPSEVLIEVHAAAINPSDVKNVSGNMESDLINDLRSNTP